MVSAVNPRIFEVMHPDEIKHKKVLLSPLNWGYGHVSRSIGLIDQLLRNHNQVVIACDSDQKDIYLEYFPDLSYVDHLVYPFKFKGKGNFAIDLILSWSKLKKRLKSEIKEVENMVEEYRPDIIISDHRYGFYSEKVPSIFVTHQYNLPVKWYQRMGDKVHKKLMNKFNYVWIMDKADNSLAGKLSATNDSKAIYIGPYSRFSLYDIPSEKTIDKLAVISGPKVYAQQFADWVVKMHPDALVVCDDLIELPKTITRISGSWKHQDAKILETKHLISRSGYSTIMDAVTLNVEATCIPTPGQAEQIYLANRFKYSD